MPLRIPTPREWSNVELRKALRHLPGIRRVVNISGWQDSDKEGSRYRDYFPQAAEYRISNYAGDKNRGGAGADTIAIDLSRPLPSQWTGYFDLAFSHTVLEHVPDPVFAFSQIAAASSDIVITIVPFKQKLHFEAGQYGDYYRFTPFSLRRMHEQNKLTLLYESYTPRPSLDVYLFCVATKSPEAHSGFPKSVASVEKLDQILGQFSAGDLARNIVSRFAGKYFPR